MEAEAFPIRFTRGVRAYWRRRRYHRLVEAGGGNKARGGGAAQQLGRGAAGRGGGWGAVRRRLRVRVRAFMTAPRCALARARDAYVGGMLAVARKASAVALPGGPESFWARRVPRRKQPPPPSSGAQPTEFEQRLIFEIYKSIVASKELTTMLHSSTSHRQTAAVHLLDM